MSEELLFDSERQERKARRKTWLIPLLVLAALIVLVILVQVFQSVGTHLAAKADKRLKNK